MIRECIICGKEFDSPLSNKKTCSDACSYERKKEYVRARYRAKHKLPITRECVMCGAIFTLKPNGNRQVYCSPECRDKTSRERNTASLMQVVKKEKRVSLDERLKQLHESGQSYAEYQAQQTLQQVEPIRTVI